MRTLSDRLLAAFDRWFSSAAGVYQTLVAVVAVVGFERVFPHLDPSMFALMAWLTIYSAVTQPALAHTAATSARRLEQIAERIATLEAQQLEQQAAQATLLTTLYTLTAGQNEQIARIEARLP